MVHYCKNTVIRWYTGAALVTYFLFSMFLFTTGFAMSNCLQTLKLKSGTFWYGGLHDIHFYIFYRIIKYLSISKIYEIRYWYRQQNLRCQLFRIPNITAMSKAIWKKNWEAKTKTKINYHSMKTYRNFQRKSFLSNLIL